jgi:hypothetical protein
MRELGRASVIIWLKKEEAAALDRVRGRLRRSEFAKHMTMNGIQQVLQTQKAR